MAHVPDLLLTTENRKLKAEIKALRRDLLVITESVTRHTQTRAPIAIKPRGRLKRTKEDRVRIIVTDTHGAAIDKTAAAAFLADVQRLNPHEVVLLGDHVDCGGFLAQNHTLGYVAETAYSYEQDIAEANAFLTALQAAAPRATFHMIEGNHERRVERWCVTQTLAHARDAEMLRRAFAPEFLLRLKERGIRYYRQGEFYDSLPVPGTIRLGKCYFWHGTSAARHAAAANIAKVGGNIVFGHTHRSQAFQIRPVAAGEISAWNPGCLCRLQPLWNHTNPNDWTHGYAVQLVAKSDRFLHLNIPIIGGESLLMPLTNRVPAR